MLIIRMYLIVPSMISITHYFVLQNDYITHYSLKLADKEYCVKYLNTGGVKCQVMKSKQFYMF